MEGCFKEKGSFVNFLYPEEQNLSEFENEQGSIFDNKQSGFGRKSSQPQNER
jgi:hypothetical protein